MSVPQTTPAPEAGRGGGRDRSGKVVVNRSMSLDGFIAGPGHAMDWVFDFVAPDEFPEIAAATGAMLIGRRTYEVANRMKADQHVQAKIAAAAERARIAGTPSGDAYGFSGPVFVLTHEPPDPPDPEVTFLTGDIEEAVATARDAAGGRNLEILGADVAGQCLRRGLVDEILVYVLPVLLGDGIRFYSPLGLARIDLEPLGSTRSGAVTILRFRVRAQASV
jgi:dihydrofolate reductase